MSPAVTAASSLRGKILADAQLSQLLESTSAGVPLLPSATSQSTRNQLSTFCSTDGLRTSHNEGLYSSNLNCWRRQRDLGTLAPKQRGRKPNPNKKETQELAKLKRDNTRLTEQLRQAELIIEVQKKIIGVDGNQAARDGRLIAAEELGRQVGVSNACDALTVSPATLYRRRRPPSKTVSRVPSPRAVIEEERNHLRQLYSERFIDRSPYQVYATLLDEGNYLCSIRAMYRILAQNNTNQERRN